MERRAITIQGTVQGVGFRPFVYRLAKEMGLGGFVRNENGQIHIEIEGAGRDLDLFGTRLTAELPVLARIEALRWEKMAVGGESLFHIMESARGEGMAGGVVVSADIGTCAACLREMLDPGDRRFGYAFTNCTNCGPRLTIVTGAPYDRARTTMAGFAMCAACRREYEDPEDRRFHAQPIACAVCGPKLKALDGGGAEVVVEDAVRWFAAGLRAGGIGAMKGLGGFHLVCEAGNAGAVGELRRRKGREEKPFAVMVGDVEGAAGLCEVGEKERELLTSAGRPIVLLRKRAGAEMAEGVAPGNPFLGVMLPYTPLHYLLMGAAGGRALVMTSGNRSDEPIAIEEGDAVERLQGIADFFLVHDRPIRVRCDDSVVRVAGGEASLVRRSRGYAPQPIRLPFACPAPILAVGGQLKATFALGRERGVVVSHHIGDLEHVKACEAMAGDIGLYERLFEIGPRCIAHDLHPDYGSTRYALGRAGKGGVRLVGVQHHHAHMASCMAEHGLREKVIGVTFDGTGLGTDGAVWGGEFLVGDYAGFRRAGHLRYVGMPGGERAVREPWRMAASQARDAGVSGAGFERRVEGAALKTVWQMLEKGFNTPRTSSAGRLFDAVASLAGVRDVASYEGQAAMELEWIATSEAEDGAYPFEMNEEKGTDGEDARRVIDTRPMIRAIAYDAGAGVGAGRIARRFHSTVVGMISAACLQIRKATGIEDVVLSGGVFLNAILSVEARNRLREEGFRVYCHQMVPTNDGGLSLGQVAVAANQWMAD